MIGRATLALLLCCRAAHAQPVAVLAADFETAVAPLVKSRCVKCHGPTKAEGGLNLSTPSGMLRGGESGPVLAAHDVEASTLWLKVAADEMPPDDPLSADEKELLRRWITAGAPGLSTAADRPAAGDHWAFRPLAPVPLPPVRDTTEVRNPIDRFIVARLEAESLGMNRSADHYALLRRMSLLVTGLPPSVDEIRRFASHEQDPATAAERMADHYLASPRFGERWGKFWLDAAGYADSNGYFNADSDRPLAYRYRDYVIRSHNEDRPFDRQIREQVAGDELAHVVPDQTVSWEMVEQLEATHYLRNGPDGTSESDGNPDELRVDRYAALEACQQNVVSSLFGLTIQCAKCHDHKFEPITQADYYRLQSVFYPVFPAAHEAFWRKPRDRTVRVYLPGQRERWEAELQAAEQRLTALQTEYAAWTRATRPSGQLVFADSFDSPDLNARWTSTVPGDSLPAGSVPVRLDVNDDVGPVARGTEGRLQIAEHGAQGSSWLVTREIFDWSPEQAGEFIQVSFELCDTRVAPQEQMAERVGYLIGLTGYRPTEARAGNLLIDGNPAGATTVYFSHPTADARRETIGATGYAPGRTFGVRVTRHEDGQLRLEHVVDGAPDGPAFKLADDELPDGAFGFEFCCGRSFVIDNLAIERMTLSDPTARAAWATWHEAAAERHAAIEQATAVRDELAGQRPGELAWATAATDTQPRARLLVRGNYADATDEMPPTHLTALSPPRDSSSSEVAAASLSGEHPRLAWARASTDPAGPSAALIARVQMNRLWQHYFGTGIVATTENLGLSGAPPTHPELLDWLAQEFVRSGWSVKHMHRLILTSATFRQASELPLAAPASQQDPSNRWWGRYPVLRLDAESIRDSMLSVSGDLDLALGGRYVPTGRDQAGEVLIGEDQPGGRRRSIYLQQRRTQVVSFLQLFDAPAIVFNSTRRPRTTMPLQSLSLLNSPFVRARAASWADRLSELDDTSTSALVEREQARIARALLQAWGRPADPQTLAGAKAFLDQQQAAYTQADDARRQAWIDFCQSLMISSEFLYLE